MNSWFDGVPEKKTQDFARFNLLEEITYGLTCINTNSNSRINDTFGKSFMLRYVMNLIGETHSPLNNINRYSNAHPDGDQNGKLHKLSYNSANSGIIESYLTPTPLNATASNLHDAWGSAFGAFGKLSFPLTKLADVQKIANEIKAAYSRDSLATDLKDISKKAWSDASTLIAKTYAYTLGEGQTASADYKAKALAQIKWQIALAAYRVSDNVEDSMGKYKPRAS